MIVWSGVGTLISSDDAQHRHFSKMMFEIARETGLGCWSAQKIVRLETGTLSSDQDRYFCT
jgi:hypothetical protein